MNRFDESDCGDPSSGEGVGRDDEGVLGMLTPLSLMVEFLGGLTTVVPGGTQPG